jgi:hypothetical protein
VLVDGVLLPVDPLLLVPLLSVTKRVAGGGSVPRTHHNPGVQMFPFNPVPSALQELFAWVTIPLRTTFKACSSCVVPGALSVANGAIAEQLPAVAKLPSRLCGRPSSAIAGIPALLLRTGAAVVAPKVTIPAGRIEGATTSKRSNLREPLRPVTCDVAAKDVNM